MLRGRFEETGETPNPRKSVVAESASSVLIVGAIEL
jgi:hypothetical protein